MPFQIVLGDITELKVDAIVNAANSSLLGGGGVDGAIHRAAGPRLLEECRTLHGCRTGEAKVTLGYDLPSKYVIHTVGPIWQGGRSNEEELLRSAYRNSLQLAFEKNCESVAFPLISSGVYGYPKDQALKIAEEEIRRFLDDHEMDVTLVIFSKESFRFDYDLYSEISGYIRNTYVSEKTEEKSKGSFLGNVMRSIAFGGASGSRDSVFTSKEKTARPERKRMDACASVPVEKQPEPEEICGEVCDEEAAADNEICAEEAVIDGARFDAEAMRCAGAGQAAAASAMMGQPAFAATQMQMTNNSLEAALANLDESFSQSLLRIIDAKGMKDSECYKKANVDRKLFSKIRSDIHYRPSKQTVLAFAVALELDISETEALLKKAGFALSHASKFDIIVEYFISNRKYDLYTINEALFAFDQNLLGA